VLLSTGAAKECTPIANQVNAERRDGVSRISTDDLSSYGVKRSLNGSHEREPPLKKMKTESSPEPTR